MKARDVLEKYGVNRHTLCRWVKEGFIKVEKSPSGRYDYIVDRDNVIVPKKRENILYARVSTPTQKENMKRQIERMKTFCFSKGMVVNNVYSDVASALNYKRKGYETVFNKVIAGEVENLVVEYKDRLLRIGYEDFERLCQKFKTNIIVIDESLYDTEKDKQKEITQDLISIIHHFSMRIYSSRKRKNIISELQKEEN